MMKVKLYEDDCVKVEVYGLIEVFVSTPDGRETSIAVPPSTHQAIDDVIKGAKNFGAEEAAFDKIREALLDKRFK